MRFEGFGDGAVEFYEGLAADNSKAYWSDHLAVYREQVRAPMEALLAELEPEFAAEVDSGGATGKGKVFRPHREVRFSKDKSPYKTHCGAVVEAGRGGGAYYAEISADGLLVAGGCFHAEPDQLARYRAAVDEPLHGKALEEILAALGKRWELGGDVLATRPRGVAADHPRLELLRHRSLHVARRWAPDDVLHERGCLTRVRTAWRELRELNRWCADHVGPSDRRR
ncbi:DUF2461 domain-containing protein [Saccharopolyspora gregorii]|uniref:DUF2461 domain-containing protein n=1 Tax=Saccharopolyspora gregorii TaxID=33914 RepID=UPI0021AC6E0E|nr:DUF2461 domain-containing protein [Saccharopolyspora gregorii]